MGPFSGRSWGGQLYEALESRKYSFSRFLLLAIQNRGPYHTLASCIPESCTPITLWLVPLQNRPPLSRFGGFFLRIVHPYHNLASQNRMLILGVPESRKSDLGSLLFSFDFLLKKSQDGTIFRPIVGGTTL